MAEPAGLRIWGVSDIGRVRGHNEDAIRWDAAGGWAVLADGMGGHLAGEVASAMAVELVGGRLASLHPDSDTNFREALRAAVTAANTAVYTRAEADTACSNMGTTLEVVLLRDGVMTCAHVGDSRLYRYSVEGLVQLSHDHSLVQELLDEGFLSEEEARESTHKNVITRALGLKPALEADLCEVQAVPGDRFLLCSDGLSDKLTADDLRRFLAASDLQRTAQEMVAEANRRGGEDNISLILIEIE